MTREEFIRIIKKAIDIVDYDVATDVELGEEINYEPYLNNFSDAIRTVNRTENKEIAFKWLKTHNCTCINCNKKDNCEYVFDEYNINGDCIAEK